METNNIEIETNGTPQLSEIPADIMDLFVTALLEEVLEIV